MRIQSILFQLAAVVLLPGFLAAVVAVSKVRDSEREVALRGLVETVRATALVVDGEVKQSLGALTGLATSSNLQTGEFKALYAQALAIDRAPSVWTFLIDDNGVTKFNTVRPYGTPPPKPVAKNEVASVLATRQPWMSDLVVGPVTNRQLTAYFVPAPATPVGNFAVAQVFAASHWNDKIKHPKDRDDWIIAILDRTGKLIWRSHRAEEYLGQSARPELIAAAAAAHSGELRTHTLDGIDSYVAFTHSELTGWTVAVAAPVPSIEASAMHSVLWFSAAGVFAIALGLLAASLLSRKFLDSFATTSNAAQALGRGEMPVKSTTPITELNALNTALQDAAGLLHQEKLAREKVESERELLLQAERAAREAAQYDNLQKDKFLALLGHELRNPLAAIMGASDVLNRGAKDTETRERFVHLIQRQARHLRRIVDDLLDVSRMLTGKIVLDAKPLNLAESVRHSVEALQATPRAADFRWRLHTDEVWIHGDAVRIEQVMNNLMLNAMNFSPPSGEIAITVSLRETNAMVQVTDAGPGIAPELHDMIFEPFKQGPPLTGQQSAGLGIGLALVRQLVQLHHGSVSVSSGAGGKGAAFVVLIPSIAAPVDAGT